MAYATNKSADQPAHPRSIISAFVVRCVYDLISKLVKPKIARLHLVSIVEHVGLSLTLSQTPEGRFSCDVAHLEKAVHMCLIWCRSLLFILHDPKKDLFV